MNGESPKPPSANQLVLQYIQRNGDRPPTLLAIAERLRCTPTAAYEVVKPLLHAGVLNTIRTNDSIVYVARRPA